MTGAVIFLFALIFAGPLISVIEKFLEWEYKKNKQGVNGKCVTVRQTDKKLK